MSCACFCSTKSFMRALTFIKTFEVACRGPKKFYPSLLRGDLLRVYRGTFWPSVVLFCFVSKIAPSPSHSLQFIGNLDLARAKVSTVKGKISSRLKIESDEGSISAYNAMNDDLDMYETNLSSTLIWNSRGRKVASNM